MTEPAMPGGDAAPVSSRVKIDPMVALGELQAENQYWRNRCLLLANELHALRNQAATAAEKDES